MKHFLKDSDFSAETAESVLKHAIQLKRERTSAEPSNLHRQTWGMLFHKSSTRTRVSFEVGINELGGDALMLDQSKMQLGRGETVEDTAKVLSRYLHGIIIRTYDQSFLEDFAASAGMPVVNALTNEFHPCQIYSDAQTLVEYWGGEASPLATLKGRKLAFLGDCASNMAHSWILGGALFGMEISLAGPEGFAPSPFIDEELKKAGLEKTYTFSTDAESAAADADAVYTDVWVSMGDEEEREERLRVMQPYQVNRALMAKAKNTACFLHCLPAHTGEEVSQEVYDSPASIVFDQAENRLHCQKAILCEIAETK